MIVIFIIVAFIIGVALFINLHPVFGGKPDKMALKRMEASSNYKDGVFVNMETTKVMAEDNSMFSTMIEWIKGPENGTPDSIETLKFNKEKFVAKVDSNYKITWFGHSTVMINMFDKVILTDPVFSDYASPLPFTNRSFKYTNPYTVDDLPEIDYLLISHDHYDHLDWRTIEKLDKKVKAYYVPLGVESHLISWGVDPAKIHVADWWEEFKVDENITLVSTPARHFSGRAFTRNTTLWCSWVIKSDEGSIFFGADSGYGKHFKLIGDKYGPFVSTFIECGQYNKNWANIHAMPEQSVQAHIDLKGDKMFTIHWGKFQLALHSWTDPIERARKESSIKGVNLVEPVIGDVVSMEY